MFKRIQIVVNPAAGRDEPILNTLNTVFQDTDVRWDVSITKDAGDGLRLARQAIEAGADAVAAYGGDGTIREAAAGLVGSDVPLAILPGGTANAIALALGIPTDLKTAASLMVNGGSIIRQLDVGKVNEEYFLVAVGIGIAGALAESADRGAKDRLGVVAYALSAFEALRDSRPARYHMMLDGTELEEEGVTCIIANAGGFGLPGVTLAQSISLDDGLLDVILISRANLESLLALAASMAGQSQTTATFQHWQVRKVAIRVDPPQAVQVDGEVLGKVPVAAEVLPGALRVLVPRTEGD